MKQCEKLGPIFFNHQWNYDEITASNLNPMGVFSIDDYAKDGGEELFTKMHWVLQSNSYRIVKESQLERNASW